MAKSERDFQSELLRELRKQDHCHALKVSSFTIGGIPDLYIKRLGYRGLWLELKYETYRPVFKAKGVPVNLSTLQRHFIAREQDSGGDAGWAVCVAHESAWLVYADHDPDIKSVSFERPVTVRHTGQPWDLNAILKAVHKP